MAYDLNKMQDLAIKILKEDKGIITDLQLFGTMGVSSDYFYRTLMTSGKSGTIETLLDSNRRVGSRTATDCLMEQTKKGNVRAAETLGRIADKQILQALAPNRDKDTTQVTVVDHSSIEELKKEIQNLVSENGFHTEE
jgi:hypothetical protein